MKTKYLYYTVALNLFSLFISLNLQANDIIQNESLEFNQELPVFKWIQLESYPNIKVPIYKSTGTHGPGVLFIHGNSSSSRAFHKQINSDLGRHYKLFFLDLPGHGLASKVDVNTPMPMLEGSNMPAGLKQYQEGVPEAIKLVANDPDVLAEIIVGWSLGGHVAIKAQSLDYLPLVKGIFVLGTAPATRYSPIKTASFRSYGLLDYATGMPLLPSLGLSFKLSTKEPYLRLDSKFTDSLPWYTPSQFSFYPSRGYAYLTAFFNFPPVMGPKVPDFIFEDGFDRSDDRFRTSLAVMALEIDPRNQGLPTELDHLIKLAKDKVVLGVAVGEKDMFINPNYLQELKNQGYLNTLWQDEIKIFENAGHATHLEQPKEFNLMIKNFIEDINK